MVYKIALLIWIISISTLIIILEKSSKNKYLLIVSQIYNFMTGFLSWAIYFISIIFFLKYSRGSLANIFACYIFSTVPLLLLLIPLNIKVKKKIDINTAGYVILSVFITVLGLGMFIFLANLLSI